MNQDIDTILANHRAQKNAGGISPVISGTPAGSSDIDTILANHRAQKKPSTPTAPEKESNGFLKSLVAAPATLVARPFQAVAQGVFNVSPEEIDAFSKEKLGGFVAPVPQNLGDVKKDIGRAVQTVAYGTGAPIAGGAAFGLGSSLEQGNDLFSAKTAVDTTLGALGGKALEWVGKPLLNKAGEVIGAITPLSLQKVLAKGPEAVQKFAEQHQLLGGVGAPLSRDISKGFQAIDTGVGNLFKGTGKGISNAISSQYPNAKQKTQDYFLKKDSEQLFGPATSPKNKVSRGVFEKAKNNQVDLPEVAKNTRTFAQDLIDDNGVWDVTDAVKNLRSEAAAKGPELLRPALREAEPGVRRIPISEIRDQMLKNADSISTTKITDAERQTLKDRLSQEFADDSPAALAHPDGYSLTDLYDNKLGTSDNVIWNKIFKPNVNEKFSNTYYKNQTKTFDKFLQDNVPDDVNYKAYKKNLEGRFLLADYLESLQGKNVPKSLFQRSLKSFGRVAGAAAGGATGNIYGMFGGSQLGGMFVDSFMNLSNPAKSAALRSLQSTDEPVFKAMSEYLGKQETERLLRLRLPAGSKIDANLTKLMNERGAIPMNRPQSAPVDTVTNDMIQNMRIFGNSPRLPAGRSSIVTPNKGGTPNPLSRAYSAGGEQPQIGGMQQRKRSK